MTDQQVADALKDSGGLVTLACEQLGISRPTLYGRLKASATLREALQASRERKREQIVKAAEDATLKLVEAGHAGMVQFALERQGKDRGWAPPAQQVSHSFDFQVEHILPELLDAPDQSAVLSDAQSAIPFLSTTCEADDADREGVAGEG